MQYAALGSTGLRVSRMVLGGWSIGLPGVDEDRTKALLRAAWDLGINTIDTADAYHAGVSEELYGKALKEHRREDIVVMTKVRHRVGADTKEMVSTMSPGEPNYGELMANGITPMSWGLSRKHIFEAVEASLRRLQTDYIDVYQVHAWDYRTPIEETLGALNDLVRQGKVRYIGASVFSGWQLQRALWASDVNNWESFVSCQTALNLLFQDVGMDLLPSAVDANVGVMVFQTLASGLLAGAFDRSKRPDKSTRFGHDRGDKDTDWSDWSDERLDFVDRLKEVAAEAGRTPAELAQGWVMAQQGVTAILMGAELPEHLPDQVKIADHPLTTDELAAVNGLLT